MGGASLGRRAMRWLFEVPELAQAGRAAGQVVSGAVDVATGGKAKKYKGLIERLLPEAFQGKGGVGSAVRAVGQGIKGPWTAYNKFVGALPRAIRYPYKGALYGTTGYGGYQAYKALSNPGAYAIENFFSPEALAKMPDEKRTEIEGALTDVLYGLGKHTIWRSKSSPLDQLHTDMIRRNIWPTVMNSLRVSQARQPAVQDLLLKTPTGLSIDLAERALTPDTLQKMQGMGTLEKLMRFPSLHAEATKNFTDSDMMKRYMGLAKAIASSPELRDMLMRQAMVQLRNPNSMLRKELAARAPELQRTGFNLLNKNLLGYAVRRSMQGLKAEEPASPTELTRNLLADFAARETTDFGSEQLAQLYDKLMPTTQQR